MYVWAAKYESSHSLSRRHRSVVFVWSFYALVHRLKVNCRQCGLLSRSFSLWQRCVCLCDVNGMFSPILSHPQTHLCVKCVFVCVCVSHMVHGIRNYSTIMCIPCNRSERWIVATHANFGMLQRQATHQFNDLFKRVFPSVLHRKCTGFAKTMPRFFRYFIHFCHNHTRVHCLIFGVHKIYWTGAGVIHFSYIYKQITSHV